MRTSVPNTRIYLFFSTQMAQKCPNGMETFKSSTSSRGVGSVGDRVSIQRCTNSRLRIKVSGTSAHQPDVFPGSGEGRQQ